MLIEKFNVYETLCSSYLSLGCICALLCCYVLLVQFVKLICATFTKLLRLSTKKRFCYGYCVRRVKEICLLNSWEGGELYGAAFF